jgi:hypothetical protein
MRCGADRWRLGDTNTHCLEQRGACASTHSWSLSCMHCSAQRCLQSCPHCSSIPTWAWTSLVWFAHGILHVQDTHHIAAYCRSFSPLSCALTESSMPCFDAHAGASA